MFIYELLIAISVKTLSFRENRKKTDFNHTHDSPSYENFNLAQEGRRDYSDTPN